RESPTAAEHVAEEIRKVAEAITGYCQLWKYDRERLPEKKPHGRLAWSFYFDATGENRGPYLDVSVVPRISDILEAKERGENDSAKEGRNRPVRRSAGTGRVPVQKLDG